MRQRWVGIVFLLFGLAVAWGFWSSFDERRCREELARARAEISSGRYGNARVILTSLLEQRPGWDEAAYELGVCEQAKGRVEPALEAWEKVRRDSPLAGWVEVRRSRIELGRGRYSDSEDLLRSAAARPGPHVAEARWGLVLLLRLQGRFDEARRWLEDGFDQMTDPVETLRRLYRLETDLFPTEGVRLGLDRAGRQAPEDDRVWLAKANLAIRLARFEEAKTWLDRCRELRPDDVAVWRMWLDWAIAAGRPDDTREAVAHLRADQEADTRVLSLRAWFSAQYGDRKGEQRALQEKLEIDPLDAPTLERLAELTLEAGNAQAAATLRRRKAEAEQTRKEYARLLFGENPRQNAAELAGLADRLGRRFDARRWSILTHEGSADSAQSVPTAAIGVSTSSTVTLADLLRDVIPPMTSPARIGLRIAQAAPNFTDDAEAVGLHFVHQNGASSGRLIPPVTSSGGVGLIDVDSDGWLDVYVVQGGPFPPEPGASQPSDCLFRNRGDGTFDDITEKSGISSMARGYGHGIAVGDYDNDGRSDVFITRWRSYALYHNRGDGTFEDVTASAGLGGDRDWPTSAAFADLDNDGDLDLYVCHYLKWDEHDLRTCSDPNDPTVYNCGPLDFEPLPDHVFRNDHGRFAEVTREAGFDDRTGRGLGVLAADLDDDGRVDLFVANDMTANYLYKNLGGFRFEEVGLAAGVAGNASGGYQAGMGVACGDLDGDGRSDLAVTNFYNESATFFRNLGKGFFGDHSSAIGIRAPSRYLLGFGIVFLDIDNDGWLDVMTANGHVHDGRPQYPWLMPIQILRNEGGARPRLSDVSARAGTPFQIERMGRALAAGDLDNDGRIDALAVSQNEPLVYLHNRTEAKHFLVLRLEGTKSNRDAVGARVTLTAGKHRQVAQRFGGGSYQAAGDPRLHFGLESINSVDQVEVRWPSGQVDYHLALEANRGYLLREGESRHRPLPGLDQPGRKSNLEATGRTRTGR